LSYLAVDFKSIFDLRGALICELVNEITNPSIHSVVWNGTDEYGNKVLSGVYIYQLKVGKFTKSNRMLLVR
jgi:hypothetical protein